MVKNTTASVRASGATLRNGSEKKRIDPADNEFLTFALEEAEDNRIMRASLWFAVVFHAVLLLINFPALDSPPAADPGDRVVHAFEIERYRPPPPLPPDYVPPEMVKPIPVPDETPHDPEPIPLDEQQAEISLPDIDTDFIIIPNAPPAPPEPAGPYTVGGDVIRPVKIHAPLPSYPDIARKARIQGTVIVQAIIDKRGDVTDIKVLKQLPMGLTEAAVGAMTQWKFKPATLNGKPVDVYYHLTVTFSLQ